jgi:hypothetical protein
MIINAGMNANPQMHQQQPPFIMNANQVGVENSRIFFLNKLPPHMPPPFAQNQAQQNQTQQIGSSQEGEQSSICQNIEGRDIRELHPVNELESLLFEREGSEEQRVEIEKENLNAERKSHASIPSFNPSGSHSMAQNPSTQPITFLQLSNQNQQSQQQHAQEPSELEPPFPAHITQPQSQNQHKKPDTRPPQTQSQAQDKANTIFPNTLLNLQNSNQANAIHELNDLNNFQALQELHKEGNDIQLQTPPSQIQPPQPPVQRNLAHRMDAIQNIPTFNSIQIEHQPPIQQFNNINIPFAHISQLHAFQPFPNQPFHFHNMPQFDRFSQSNQLTQSQINHAIVSSIHFVIFIIFMN